MTRIMLILGLTISMAACSGDRGPRGAGLPYDARLAEGETWRAFTVQVRAPGAMLVQARESARYVATRHCLERTGFSEADWVIDTATGDWAVARTEDGEPIVTGRCAQR
jgi:hypothetical protein